MHVGDSGIALDDVQRGRLQAAFDFRQIRRRNLQPLSRLLLLEVVIDSDQAKSFTQHCISFQEAIQGANYWRKTLMMERAMWSSCTTTRPKATTVRSEEHTSELQSLMRISYAVFCLKKKKTEQNKHTYQNSLK